jgi:hypothetical protein
MGMKKLETDFARHYVLIEPLVAVVSSSSRRLNTTSMLELGDKGTTCRQLEG